VFVFFSALVQGCWTRAQETWRSSRSHPWLSSLYEG